MLLLLLLAARCSLLLLLRTTGKIKLTGNPYARPIRTCLSFLFPCPVWLKSDSRLVRRASDHSTPVPIPAFPNPVCLSTFPEGDAPSLPLGSKKESRNPKLIGSNKIPDFQVLQCTKSLRSFKSRYACHSSLLIPSPRLSPSHWICLPHASHNCGHALSKVLATLLPSHSSGVPRTLPQKPSLVVPFFHGLQALLWLIHHSAFDHFNFCSLLFVIFTNPL